MRVTATLSDEQAAHVAERDGQSDAARVRRCIERSRQSASSCDRVDELEARLDDLEPEVNQQPGDESASMLVNDERAAEESREPPSSDGQPQGSDVQDVVEYVRENGPVSRSETVAAFRDEWDQLGIKGDSWWRRHARDELEKAGAEFRRNRGWEIKE